MIKAIWDGNEQGAWQKLRLMADNLATRPDIVRLHRNLLLRKYRQQFDQELAIYKDMFGGEEAMITRDSESFRKMVAVRETALTEGSMINAIRAGSSPEAMRRLQEQSPEDLLGELGL